jgi:hypothetical protein
MNFAKARLLIAAVLLGGWLAYLGYLAYATNDPIVLSRPQFLVSGAYVIADVKEQNDQPVSAVTIKEVVWDPAGKLAAGQTIEVKFLPKPGKPLGWENAGTYILPLTRRVDGKYSVTPLPPSPGFAAEPASPFRFRIYTETPSTVRQLRDIVESQKGT